MLASKLKEFGNVIENTSFKEKTSFKIGGKIKYFIEIENVNNLCNLIKFLNKNQISYFILGNGTNILASDEDFDIVVISLKKMNQITISDDNIGLDVGVSSMYTGIYLVSLGYDAVLPLALIPATVGGIVYMNASSYGESISDYLEKIEYVDCNGNICILDDFSSFKYRYSPFMDNLGIITKVYLKVSKNKEAEVKLKKYWLCKKNSQPLNTKNAGCVFKNPYPFKAWKILKELKLDNLSIGDAYVSNKHTNFLINKNNASFLDMYSLISLIKKEVYEKTKINLELEIKIITPNDFIPYQL